MGAGASKQGDSTAQVFTSENPVQFSQDLIDSLQASSETNSTRAKSLELHIQQRVAAELKRIQEEESAKLAEITQKITASADGSEKEPKKPKSRAAGLLYLPELPTISAQDLLPKSESPEEKARKNASSQKVQEEIDKLKKALGERKILKELPKEVEQARNSVVACLRTHDRQPLDCWREVELFKQEVRKMEEKFVGNIL